MSDYSEPFRTLDVWDCFEARGKFCHHDNFTSMMQVTGSSNLGHGLCCKPDYTGEHCHSDGDHECSEPAIITDVDSKYGHVVDEHFLNYQMFAWNTLANQASCGISNDS